MCKTVKAQPGYVFILTDKGKENPKVCSKYNPDYIHRDQYKYSVPEKWIEEGYVVEVRAL